MKTILMIMVMGMMVGCNCGDCAEIEACIDEHEAALGEYADPVEGIMINPDDGLPFDWEEDCPDWSVIPKDTYWRYFCEHTSALMDCQDEYDDRGC